MYSLPSTVLFYSIKHIFAEQYIYIYDYIITFVWNSA